MLTRISLPYSANATDLFQRIADLPWSAWLDSGGLGRFDILVAQPVVTLVTHGKQTSIASDNGGKVSEADPFELLKELLGEPALEMPGVLFAGGALGFWGYDLARRYIELPEQITAPGALPEMAVGIYDWAIQLDHQLKKAELLSWHRYARTSQDIGQILELFGREHEEVEMPFSVEGAIQSSFTRETYSEAFSRVQHYLQEGDCYQVNLAQRFSAKAAGNGLAAYRKLRELTPAPYAAYLNFPEVKILSASPERFLRVSQREVETRPIKGTRRRLADEELDARTRAELQVNPKDRAENLMIVDLLRNDLGKVCEPGSIRATEMFAVESYATVHHLVSTVIGNLAPGLTALDLLRACFPGGSITGAPKLRAMEIIAQLESDRRNVYCGAIGYVGFDGNMDTNIAIRTMTLVGGELSCWAGGGIVADSQCEAEYQETLDKAAAMLRLMGYFGAEKWEAK